MKKNIRTNIIRRLIVFLLTLCIAFICIEQIYSPHILLSLQVNKACDLNVFYDNGAVNGYCFDDEHVAQTSSLSPGEQTVKVYIPRESMKRLRLDFGNEPCNVELYALSFVSNVLVSYDYAAEEIFYSFKTLNDISWCDYKDGVAMYTVSGTDGHIAALSSLPMKAATLHTTRMVLQVILLLSISLLMAIGDHVYCFFRKAYKRHSRMCKYLTFTLAIEIILLLVCPLYWFIETVFAICFGCGLCYALEYFGENKTLFRDYFGISLVCIIALMPLFLTGFYYGDSYWSRSAGMSAEEYINLPISMKRPFVGIVTALFREISVENSYIMRTCFAVCLIFSGILLYKFVLTKLKSQTTAYILCIFLCASVIAVDSLAYLEIYPIIFSLLFSIIAYLAWEQFTNRIKKGFSRRATLDAFIMVISLLAAFYMYQIGTPVFFVMLVISILSENESDKAVLKKGIVATLFYSVIAIVYLLSTPWIQNIYHVANIQSERANFIHTLPAIIEKITWFFGTVLPQSIHRIWASILPSNIFTANNLFYTISYKEEFLGIALLVFAGIVIFLFLVSCFLQGYRKKAICCLCSIFLSFYPFLLLPESTILTYYILPLIILLEVFFILGLREIFRREKVRLKQRKNIKVCDVKRSIIMLLTLLVVVNSAKYANYWVLYCRDSYQYIKQYILSNKTDDISKIHVYGKIAPNVGGGPYIVGAVERIFEEIGEDPSQYSITQSDTTYAISQLTENDAQALYKALLEPEYEKFMSYYIFSEFYHCYYIKTNSFTPEDQKFLQGCLTRSGLIPRENDKTTLVISMSGFNQTHSF